MSSLNLVSVIKNLDYCGCMQWCGFSDSTAESSEDWCPCCDVGAVVWVMVSTDYLPRQQTHPTMHCILMFLGTFCVCAST